MRHTSWLAGAACLPLLTLPVPVAAQHTVWMTPLTMTTTDADLSIIPGTSSNSVRITSTEADGSNWVDLGLVLPSTAKIEGVTVCYRIQDLSSFITQTRITRMMTPDFGDVVFDDGTDRNASALDCYQVAVPMTPAVDGAMTLSLRLQFSPNEWIEIGAVGIHLSSAVSAVEQPPRDSQTADPSFLRQNHPNPFSPPTSIGFVAERGGPVSIRIFNGAGQLLRTLVDGEASAGEHVINWDGRDDTGKGLPSGTYYYQLTIDGRKESRRMILVR